MPAEERDPLEGFGRGDELIQEHSALDELAWGLAESTPKVGVGDPVRLE